MLFLFLFIRLQVYVDYKSNSWDDLLVIDEDLFGKLAKLLVFCREL